MRYCTVSQDALLNACMYLCLQSNSDLADEAANTAAKLGSLLCAGSYEGVKNPTLVWRANPVCHENH